MRVHPCFSSISTYLACPAAFRVGYRDGEPPIAPANVLIGQQLHELLARYGAHCWQRRRPSDLDAARDMAMAYPPDVRKLFEDFAENWRWDWGDIIVKDATPVEQHLFGRLPSGQEFSGHVDLIQRYPMSASAFGEDDTGSGDEALWVITDWKTRIYGTFTADEAPLQLRAYAWLVQQNWPEAREFQVNMTSIADRRVVPWSLGGDLSWVGEELQAIVDRIGGDAEMEPRPGPETCPRCMYVAACPLRGTETVRSLTTQGPAACAAAVGWHEAQAKLAKNVLRTIVSDAGGPLDLGDAGIWGWKERTSLVPVDELTLRDACIAAGHDWTELLGGYDKRKVTKAIRDGWLDDGLFATKTVGKVFGLLKGESNADGDDE